MENSYIDIETNLSISEVTKKLQQITVNENTNQTTYHQEFSGQITENGARLTPIEETPRNTIVYELKFITLNSKTIVRVSNNEFDKRLIIQGLLIGLLLPLGIIILIVGFIYFDSSDILLTTLGISALLILPVFFYKAKPLTNEEYQNNDHIKTIIKSLN